MRDSILSQLDDIERQHGVKIIYACESGSRAWGFPSSDSDYDVRFIYVHPADWYLSISPGRDVIEIPVGPVFDINGWDVRKALQLLHKSNITLLEWLASPIRYRCDELRFRLFHELVPLGFQQSTSARHYLSMAKSNIKRTGGPRVRMKAYLYAVRPLLCCRWLLDFNTQPPMLFRELVAKYLGETAAGREISAMIDIKQAGKESDTVASNEVLNRFISSEWEALSSRLPGEVDAPDRTPFDEAFRTMIDNPGHLDG